MDDPLFAVRTWLCHNTDYTIRVIIVNLYGCSSFEGFCKGQLIVSRNGTDVTKNVNKILTKLKEHAEKVKE